MTVSSYAEVDGVPGPAKGEGVDDKIELYEFNYEISLPCDLRDSTITGRRQHGFFTMVHEMDMSSPLLAMHLCENKEIAKVTITHYRPDTMGDIKLYFTHEMKKVKVTGLNCWKLNTCDDKSKRFRDCETVSFMFEEIKIKDEKGNEYTDKWELGS